MSLAPSINWRRFAVLYVDDEEMSLKYFREVFKDTISVYTAPNAEMGFRLLREKVDHIGLVLSDQRMPGESGVSFLEKARKLEPRILRVLVTAYSDLETAIESVNSGAVYHYLTKPWNLDELQVLLRRSLEFFAVQVERDNLLRDKLSALNAMIMSDRAASMSILAAGLNHHMRNSLTTIKTFIDMVPEMLRQELPPGATPQQEEFWLNYHQCTRQELGKMVDILGRLWEASHEKELIHEAQVDLLELAQEAYRLLESEFEKREIHLRFCFEPNLPKQRANRAKIAQLFRLLFLDELQLLPPRAEITLGARMSPNEEHATEIWITNDRPALSDEALAHVFDPFFHRGDNPSEHGTNLMACHHIVYLHGGEIEAVNQDCHTMIRLVLPHDPTRGLRRMNESSLLSRIHATESAWERLMRPDSAI